MAIPATPTFALVSVPRLVEHHDAEVAGDLEGQAVADEQAATSRQRGRDGDHERHRQAERVRARDHHDRDGAFGHEVGAAVRERPRDHGDDARPDRDVGEPHRGPVGDRLGPGLGRLRLGDQPHDAGERRLLAGLRDPHSEGTTLVDRARDDAVPGSLVDRSRLPGDHRLIDLRLARDDLAVGRDPTAGPHEHDVAFGEHGKGPRLGPVAHDALGLIRQELRELGQRPCARPTAHVSIQ